MQTGRRAGHRCSGGFTYLWLLFVIAAGGVALAHLGVVWSTTLQRERELESMFRGQQIADAIGRWRRAGAAGGDAQDKAPRPASTAAAPAVPAVTPQGPHDLQELLEDRRWPVPVRHLRRLYEDPLTGAADWQLLRDEQGAIVALHSRSDKPARISRGLAAAEGPPGSVPPVSARIYRPRGAESAAITSVAPTVLAQAPVSLSK